MKIGMRAKRRGIVATAVAVGLGGAAFAVPTIASATSTTTLPARTVVSALSTTAYGSVLTVGGTGPLAGAPLYAISSDARGNFGCTPGPLVTTFQGPLTCTGPTSDAINNVQTDEWPALTTEGRPIAGPGVKRRLLGTVYRPGIGRQVTYAGHPLYLFDPPSNPFVPQGEGFFESVLPLPPWHGLWNLISARSGLPDPGVATIETGTLPSGTSVVAAEEYPNVVPGGAAITTYTYSRDRHHKLACRGACAVTWIPVLTTGPPQAGAGITAADLGVVRRPDGSWQVTYNRKPLYLYSQEQAQFSSAGQPLTTGTVGNGNGLSGPHGGTFSDIPAG